MEAAPILPELTAHLQSYRLRQSRVSREDRRDSCDGYEVHAFDAKQWRSGKQMTVVGVDFSEFVLTGTGEVESVSGAEEGAGGVC